MNQTVLSNRLKNMTNILAIVIFFAVLFLLMTTNIFSSEDNTTTKIPSSVKSVIYESPITLKDILLIAHDQTGFTTEQLHGRWSFLFFGYTHCPDICPATMNQLVRIKQEMQSEKVQHKNVQFIFVSVDPRRDTLEHLATYVNYFDDTFTAVTGDVTEIENLEKQIGVFHRYSKPDSEGTYRVDHSSNIYLVDPKGRVSAQFQVPMDINRVTQQYASIQELFEHNIL